MSRMDAGRCYFGSIPPWTSFSSASASSSSPSVVCKGHAVGHDVDESCDVFEPDVAAEPTARVQLFEPGFHLCVASFAATHLPLLHQLRPAPQPPEHLEVDGHPVRALGRQVPEGRVQPLLDQERRQFVLVTRRELEEERPLVREVVEDRAAREADLLLQPRDRRPLVAVARKRAAGPVENLLPAGLEMLFGDLRHPRTLQNRTSVLYSRPDGAAPEPQPRRGAHGRVRLANRLGDDLRRAPVVRPHHDGLDGEDGLGPRGRAPPRRPPRHSGRLADRPPRREAHDERRRTRRAHP